MTYSIEELEQENRLLRARNERLEREALAKTDSEPGSIAFERERETIWRIDQALAEPTQEPDMFWNRDDAEYPYASIEELLNNEICNGYLEVGAEFTILQAKKLPSIKIRVTSIGEYESEAQYEIVGETK